MAIAALLRHEASLAHETGAHPERVARIEAIERRLAGADWLGFEPLDAPVVDDAALHAVHPPEYCARLASLCDRGGGMLDLDTVASPGSWEAARRAAGGAAQAVDLLMEGDARVAFAALRPPGHHAGNADAMGFCLLNNVAIAARRALDAHGAERVLVVDWDVHHGNGTNDIFHADPRVLFVSIHQSPLYPGTGAAGDVGSGDGTGFTINLPVRAGSGDALFQALVDEVVVPVAQDFAPGLVLVSAGYDAHRADPIGGCALTEAGYAAMTGTLRRLCADLDVPLGMVLEGGYDLDALAESVAATLEVLGAEDVPAANGAASHPVAREAAARVAAHWPVLAG
jgi:acetoin utilization deacetylase AcuC-like enzyme